jgi:hypothetical protein
VDQEIHGGCAEQKKRNLQEGEEERTNATKVPTFAEVGAATKQITKDETHALAYIGSCRTLGNTTESAENKQLQPYALQRSRETSSRVQMH